MKSKLLETIDNSEKYTLAVADAMPANRFDFRPSKEVWTFAELIHHIGYGIYWWQENFILRRKSEWSPPTPPKTREAVIKYLTNSFATLKKTVTSAQLDEASIHGVYTTLDHITHHRGQATVYLRNNNITPPEYIY
jgi:uncharacterized damage-inducible protein DinB